MSREDVLWEADEVEAGRLNLNDCMYPEEVEDELGAFNFDSYGNYRQPNLNWNEMNNNTDNEVNEEEYQKTNYKLYCCLLLIIVFIIYLAL